MNLCLVEDNPLMLKSLSTRLSRENDITIACAAPTAEDALASCPWAEVEILLADIDLPGISGIELIRKVREAHPHILSMALTICEDRDTVFRALKAGAYGYLLKGSSPRSLLQSIRELHQGGSPMTPSIARQVILTLQPPQGEPAAEPLTQREQDILLHVADGELYKEIADIFGISVHTVNTHIKHIYSKLHASGRAQAIRRAREAGLLPPPKTSAASLLSP